MRRLLLLAFVAVCVSAAASAQISGNDPNDDKQRSVSISRSRPPMLPNTVSGVATITDGDTIRIGQDAIRLSGIDAPESGKTCGSADVYAQSRAALAAIIAQNQVSCIVTGEDRYGRKTGACFVAGADLAATMVTQGWARDWPRYSRGQYAAAEIAARDAHRGIWGLTCPADLWGNRNYSAQ